jgi:antitoxin MazE6
VKTAISLPDDIFEEATQRARQLGMSRSEFFARAARRYLAELTGQSLTAQIDQALQGAGEDETGSAAAAAGRRRLAGQSEW